MLETTTNRGLHDYVMEQVRKCSQPGQKALDLGAGPGALADRLHELGMDVTAADINPAGYKANLPFLRADFNDADFASKLGKGAYGLVTAVEVLEHMESPIGFLRNTAQLLSTEGIAILTTPNVDSLPARVKFLLAGKVRMMDEHSEPTHISPIFWDLLQRQYLPRAGLKLKHHLVFPEHGYQLTRGSYSLALRSLKWMFRGECLEGDNHVLILQRER